MYAGNFNEHEIDSNPKHYKTLIYNEHTHHCGDEFKKKKELNICKLKVGVGEARLIRNLDIAIK